MANVVSFAVDWVASELAHKLRSLDSVWLVTAAADSLDSSPEVIALATESEALDWINEAIDSRIEWQVQHSVYMLEESDLDHMRELESVLFTMKEESL